MIPKPESFERLQRVGTAVGLKRPNLRRSCWRRSCRLGLLSPTASSNSSPHDRSELSSFGISHSQRPLASRPDTGETHVKDCIPDNVLIHGTRAMRRDL